MRKYILLTIALIGALLAGPAGAQDIYRNGTGRAAATGPAGEAAPQADPEEAEFGRRFIHKVGAEARPVFVIPTHPFLRGENLRGQPIKHSLSAHLKYAFQFRPNTYKDLISGSAYQGVGLSFHKFYYRNRPSDSYVLYLPEKEELGNPVSFYLFQGARIAQISPKLSLNYEWNFGLSFGWSPYDYFTNEYNRVIGSKVNAYLNANFYLHYMLSRAIDLTAGVSLAHFSNGSTKLPNAGLNTAGLTVGLTYNFNRENDAYYPTALSGPGFERHMTYETVLFGAWRKKGVRIGDEHYATPDTYAVGGISFAAMYNLGYKVRVGGALDGVYDSSANLYAADHIVGTTPDFLRPSWTKQWAVGIAAQVDYVMPYFTLTLGFGANVLHGGGELKSFYQKLALKIDLTRNAFLHIGYSLRELKAPNFLMLGVGYRFNTRPQTYRP